MSKNILWTNKVLTLLFSCVFVFVGVWVLISRPIWTPYLELGKSYLEWKEKTALNSAYSYTVRFVSWTGHGTETKFDILSGRVVRKEYSSFDRSHQLLKHYTEEGKWLGSNEGGPEIKTIDQLYLQCATEVIPRGLNPKESLSLEFKNDGTLSYCLTRHEACADDCSRGVEISNISFSN